MENNLLIPFLDRVWALLIDTIILGVVELVLGLIFKNVFISLGENGRLVGWMIALAYFTVLNSKINNGQTFGKKIMSIQVADIYGNAISFKTSLTRAFILTIPFFLNGYSIPGARLFSVVTIIQSIIIFTFGIGIILLYIINKGNRQSIHDIIAKTYVVQVYRNDEVTLMPGPGKLPLYILGTLFIITSAWAVYSYNSVSAFSKLTTVYERIMKQDNIAQASVFMNTVPLTDSAGGKHFVYTVTIRTKRDIEKRRSVDDHISDPELKQTVETFIDSKVFATDNDILNIVVRSGFDIGIAKQSHSFSIYRPIYEWKELYSQ